MTRGGRRGKDAVTQQASQTAGDRCTAHSAQRNMSCAVYADAAQHHVAEAALLSSATIASTATALRSLAQAGMLRPLTFAALYESVRLPTEMVATAHASANATAQQNENPRAKPSRLRAGTQNRQTGSTLKLFF
jgi:hypothetical protein